MSKVKTEQHLKKQKQLQRKNELEDEEEFDGYEPILNENYQDGKANMQKYQIGKFLGQGSYAVVRLVKDKSDGRLYALKTYQKFKLAQQSHVKKNLIREIRILESLDHPNVVQLFQVMESQR